MTEEEFIRLMNAHSLELFALANSYADPLGNPKTPIEDKITLLKARCIAMVDMLKEHKRVWDYHSGEKVEPRTHHAAVVLEGEGAGGAA